MTLFYSSVCASFLRLGGSCVMVRGMPNKRQHGKRLLNVWVSVNTYARFAALAEELGVSMSELIVQFMEEKAARVRLSPEAAANADRRLKEWVKKDSMKKVLRGAGEVATAVEGTFVGLSSGGSFRATHSGHVRRHRR